MRIFVSWSGALSKQVAQILRTWLPRIIQSIEVFYSPEDIEKGENWDSKLSQELSSCDYGIICLTSENTSAPWIHFEAGALAKSLESHVSTLLININPSDIKGPLSRYQATRLEKDDFTQLIISINKTTETPLSNDIILPLLDMVWPKIEEEIKGEVKSASKPVKEEKADSIRAPLEEILQLLRKQNMLLSSPEELLPPAYFEYLQKNVFPISRRNESIITLLFEYLDRIVDNMARYKSVDFTALEAVQFSNIFPMLDEFICKNYSARYRERYIDHLRKIYDQYSAQLEQNERMR